MKSPGYVRFFEEFGIDDVTVSHVTDISNVVWWRETGVLSHG
jgi:hypothetical protein